MAQIRNLSLSVALLLSALAVSAQSCPKVVYTGDKTTVLSLVNAVNCLVDTTERARTGGAESAKAGLLVESFPIIGPQHTRTYRKIVFAALVVPVGNTTKTALVTADSNEASVSATAGAECKIRINPDNSVDGQCNLTGGTLYVVYHN